MTSIRKAKKAFKRNPYYKGRKVITVIWMSCDMHPLRIRVESRQDIYAHIRKHRKASEYKLIRKLRGHSVSNVKFMDKERFHANMVI